ncbi:MAG: aspartate aminotransferase family protein [Rhodospirillaceae bacterium]|nr:aspartate aminotransferase family protein [Rhodospirillaceae bacterium]
MTEQLPRRGNSPAARDIASLVHPYTNLRVHEKEGPLVIERGKGVYVYDDSGKEYIEGMAGLWSAAVGFDEPRLVAAATAAMSKLPFYHMFTHKSHMPGIELAELLLEMAPVPMSKVFFANSGSEANDTAMKLVWYYHNAIGKPEKKKIISRQKAYHGVTLATASLTGLPANHADWDLPLARVLHTDCPHHYRFGKPGESPEDFATRCAESLEALILKEGPETIGAMFAEPVMGAGGVIVPPPTYFEKIQKVLKKYEVLLIVDEVICGFYRTGNPWGTQTFGIEPDMLTCAKALSASYVPISALMVNEKVWQAMLAESDKIGTFGHGYTYSGHPLACSIAIETQKIYKERDILSHVRRQMGPFQKKMASLLEEEIVGEVRGVGLVCGIEIVKNKQTKEGFQPAGKLGRMVAAKAQENGLICRAIVDTIAICPPLIIEEAQVDELVARLRKSLREVAAQLKKDGQL